MSTPAPTSATSTAPMPESPPQAQAQTAPSLTLWLVLTRSEIERRAESASWSARVSLSLLVLAIVAAGGPCWPAAGLATLGILGTSAGLLLARWWLVEHRCRARLRPIEERLADTLGERGPEWYILWKWELAREESRGLGVNLGNPFGELLAWAAVLVATLAVSLVATLAPFGG